MDREIKFRAWVIDEKKMLENGDWFLLDPCAPCPVIQYADQGWYTNNANAIGDHLASLVKNDIKPEDDFVLMQYTGLKDKNGKEIYEGDVYRLYDRNYQVMFVNGAFCAGKNKQSCSVLGWKGSEIIDDDDTYESDWHNKIEVIGNIYENPELL